ncbi:MAG: hypothetical protein KGQ36_04075 [Rickettsiales bacterium]|nr:hypothetical protein [Rickettsiales bacterium]
MPISSVPNPIRKKINSLNDLQVRMLVSQALDQQRRISGEVTANDDLRQALSYWSKLERQKISYGDASIDETMEVAREIFGKESLKSDSEFANYIKSFAKTNSAESAQLMKLFCSCLVLADAKTPEQQEEFFLSFPPSGDDLHCLDGTKERLEIIERNLSSNKPFSPFVEASDSVMRNIADALKYDIKEGNQVHIPKYFEKSLSLIDDHVSPYAQSQIPFAKSTRFHRDYSEMFKEFALVDIGRLLEGRFKEINETIHDLKSKLPRRNFTAIKEDDNDALREIRLGLKKFGDNFLVEDEREGVVSYSLNKNALNGAGFDLPCLRFLDKVKSAPNFVEGGMVPADEGLIECRKSLLESKNIFSTEGVNNLAILANRGTPNDKVFALDIIWMLGQQLLSSSNRIFFDTVDSILQNNPNFFHETREELEKFLPGYSKKIDDILQHSHFLEHDGYFNQVDGEGSEFYDLIDCGYDTDTILRKIASFPSVDELNRDLNVTNEEGEIHQQNAKSCRRLVNRPDLGNILEAFKDKAAGFELNQQFVEVCLYFLENQRNLDDYCAVVKAIGNISSFTGSRIFHLLAESNRGDLIRDLAPMIQDHQEVLLKDFAGEFPLDLAVRKGSGDFIAEVFKILSPRDGDHPLLSCGGKSLSCLAAKYGQVESIDALYESEYDIFAQDSLGHNAVHYAVCYDKKKILDKLLEFSSNPFSTLDGINAQNSEGKTPLLFAFERDKKDLIAWMYQHGANPLIPDAHGVSPISLVLDRHDPKPLRELAKAGFDLSMYDKESGTTLIYRLLKSGRSDAVGTLIEAGYNINACDRRIGGTLAHYAVEKDFSILPSLKSFGAYLSTPDLKGITPLIKAVKSDSKEAVGVLMGLNPDLRKEFKIAFDSGKDESVAILLRLGFDINSKNSDGATMLHEIVAERNENINGTRNYSDEFLRLMKLGANPSIVDSNGFAADYLAIKNGMTAVASAIHDDRFHSIIIDAIDKGDVRMLAQLKHYSNYKSLDDPEREDVMSNRCHIYAHHAKKIGASDEVQDFIKIVVDKKKKKQEQQEEKLDADLQAIWDGEEDEKSSHKMEPPSSPNSGSVRIAETSQVAPPPQPAVEISSGVINSEGYSIASAATTLSGGGKPAANDNSIGKS